MKFQQCLAMLSSVGGLTLLYLLTVYINGGVLQEWNNQAPGRHRRSLLADDNFEQNLWNPTYLDVDECKSLHASPENTTVSTLDLPLRTSFNTHSNKQYNIPHPSIRDVYRNDLDPLTVYILPHSHVDAGWLRTIDEYYVYNVKNILNLMLKRLSMYENMTFVWAETVFLSMWWNELDDDEKVKVRRLIRDGQLEIAQGGWVMPDEASTHYVSVIDQLSEGHQWVLENLHTRPVNSWSIDPFGHSGTMPYLWKQSGMENMVIQRVHQAIKGTLAKEKSLEFQWRQYWDPTGKSEILCHIMPYIFYGAHYTCGPDQNICAMYDYGKHNHDIEGKSHGRIITDRNIEKQATYLYEQYRLKSSLFRYNTILVPLGDDFRFDKDEEWVLQYNNYMKLMEYMNSRKDWKINVQFGTLKDYFRTIREEEERKSSWGSEFTFPSVSGDFFPYSDMDDDYWTGYFTTRPFDKQFSRDVEANLRAADILNVLTRAYCKLWEVPFQHHLDVSSKLQDARRKLGLFLHHDAITGTAKPLVVQDYEQKLLQAYNEIQTVIRMMTQTLLMRGEQDGPNILAMKTARSGEMTPAEDYTIGVREKGTRVIQFNPVAQQRAEFVHIRVDTYKLEIRNSKHQVIPFQINPVFNSPTKIHSAEFEVVFLAEIPPLAIETFTLYKVAEPQKASWARISLCSHGNLQMDSSLGFELNSNCRAIHLENEFMRADFDSHSGMLQKMVDKRLTLSTNVKLEFLAYTAEGGGAYLFYPSGHAKKVLNPSPTVRVIKGPFVEEIDVIHDNLQHVIRLYDTPTVQGQGLHIENMVNLNEYDMRNRELIMRLQTDIVNKNSIFFTDQNGYQMIGRRTNPNARIETNYYPMTTMALIEDEGKQLALHSGQSHGVASLYQGSLEVMLDRQVLHDDAKGLGEGVWDNKLTLSKFILQVEYKSKPAPITEIRFTYPSLTNIVHSELFQQPVQTLFTPISTELMGASFHPVRQSLPCDVSIVSLKNLINSDLVSNGTSLILHRHGYQCKFPVLGLQCSMQDGKVNLRSLFSELSLSDVRETTLTHMYSKGNYSANLPLELSPMEIKTFYINL